MKNRSDRGQRWRTAIKRAKEVRHKLENWAAQQRLSPKGAKYLDRLKTLIGMYEEGSRQPALLRDLENTKELILGE